MDKEKTEAIKKACADAAVKWLAEVHGEEPDPSLPWSKKLMRIRALQVTTLIDAIMQAEPKEDGIESGWLIEASEAQKALFVKVGYMTSMAPTWWTGTNEQIATKHNPGWTQDASEAISFARKVDAERYILGLGYSLDNPWLIATEHRWQ